MTTARPTRRLARLDEWLTGWGWASLLCLLAWAVVGGYLTSRTFTWE